MTEQAMREKLLDTTRQLEWDVSREKFENRNIKIVSPKWEVKVGGQSTKWRFCMGQGLGKYSNKIVLGLHLTKSSQGDQLGAIAEMEDICIKSENGYFPCKCVTDAAAGGKRSLTLSKIEHLSVDQDFSDRSWVTEVGSFEDIRNMFSQNKFTVVAVLRFYVEVGQNEHIKKREREKNFVTSLRSISDLDSLADFTVICGGREFKCHRAILASMSTVFRAMLFNLQFVEGTENSVTIEDSSPDIVETMLEFMAKGVTPRDIEEKAIDLIALADKYDLQDLMQICETSLTDNMAVENVIETLIAFDIHIPKSQHRQKIINFIKKESEEIVKSKDWKKFVVKYPDLVTEIFLSATRKPVGVAGN